MVKEFARRGLFAPSRVKALRETLDIGSPAITKGWVKSVRRHKKASFVLVGDGSCVEPLQVVTASKDLGENVTTGASVSVQGTLAKGRNGAAELTDASVQVVGECDASFPLQKKYHSPEFLRDIVHLRPRTKNFGATLRVRSAATKAIHDFFSHEDFINIHAPVLTGIDCEGAGEMFNVRDPFVKDTYKYLSVSGQLHAEVFATALSKVYTFGPTFRAENSNTSRHLCEFYMVEPEVAFHQLEDSMSLAENCVKSTLLQVIETAGNDIEMLREASTKAMDDEDAERQLLVKNDLYMVLNNPWAHMTYDESIQILQAAPQTFSLEPKWGQPLQSEHERYLCEVYCNRMPVFISHYPAECKAFYMKPSSDRHDTVACFDLIFPSVGELIGGSEREDDFERLSARIQALGEQQANELDWYLDLRKYGSVPHAGW
eukprot:CAMPEP_0184545286 /NCGR_PEP_ID=MMETSP0199_2-20130426/4210_1 /TAXON_ID=1112570 /ORGANISM="Thraustochytrium sp., Strain LLF1b" /LENGTH=430 /DNA_ID=CAMNT_0026939577 /DNA_START=112 /DNA_END=1401 /DNA_ORIENTATION=-